MAEPGTRTERVRAHQVDERVDGQCPRQPARQQLPEEFEPDEGDVEAQRGRITPPRRIAHAALEREAGGTRHQLHQCLPGIDRCVEVAEHRHGVRHDEHEADPEEGHVEVDERVLVARITRHDAQEQQCETDGAPRLDAPLHATVPGHAGTPRRRDRAECRRRREQPDDQERQQQRPGRRVGVHRERHGQGIGLGEDVRAGAARHQDWHQGQQSGSQESRLHR